MAAQSNKRWRTILSCNCKSGPLWDPQQNLIATKIMLFYEQHKTQFKHFSIVGFFFFLPAWNVNRAAKPFSSHINYYELTVIRPEGGNSPLEGALCPSMCSSCSGCCGASSWEPVVSYALTSSNPKLTGSRLFFMLFIGWESLLKWIWE